MELVELQELMTANAVDTSQFGTGKAKTLEQLLDEVNANECRLEVRGGRLTRITDVMRVRVFADLPEGRLYLREVKQIFSDGRERCRTEGDQIYPAEKMLPGEWLHETLRRALKEELGVSCYTIISAPHNVSRDQDSMSYPGLPCRYNFVTMDVLLDLSEFVPEGYKERTEKLTTYFEWISADQAPVPS